MVKPVVQPIPGMTRGLWTLIEELPDTRPRRWLCQCACGTKRAVRQDQLLAGSTKSCGCRAAKIHSDAIKHALNVKAY